LNIDCSVFDSITLFEFYRLFFNISLATFIFLIGVTILIVLYRNPYGMQAVPL